MADPAVEEVDRSAPEFGESWRRYVDRFPAAAPRLALADFTLFRLRPTRVRWVGGFAQAATVTAERLRDLARGPGATTGPTP